MNVVIVGNGAAGVTAARHIRKRSPSAAITIVSGETRHHWSRPALMYIYMGQMRFQDTKPYPDHFWDDNRIDLRFGWVDGINVDAQALTLQDGTQLSYDRLILATGSTPNRGGWAGEELDRVSGMVSLHDLIALERWTPLIRHGVVVGGGLIGVELAEMLQTRGISVSLLVREPEYWSNVLPAAEAKMVSATIRAAGVDLRLETELREILGDGKGAVAHARTQSGEDIACQYVGLTIGVRPNTQIAQGSEIKTQTGIIVDEYFQTTARNIYAIGDCAEMVQAGTTSIDQTWYSAKAHGEHVARVITGESIPYTPPAWFNSAKFFGLEYQTYGTVSASPQGDEAHVHWASQDAPQSLRLAHRGGVLIGALSMGLPLRQRVLEEWFASGVSLDETISRLHHILFQPELSATRTASIQAGLAPVCP